MSFLAPKPEMPSGLGTNTPGRSATLSPSEVFPIVHGRGRVVARPMTPVLHWHYRNTSTSSYAFFSMLYGLCLGPVDEFARILVNGKGYTGIFQHRDENPGDYLTHVLSKETPETFYLGWGLETQANFTALIQSLVRSPAHEMANKAHPAYRGIAWLLVRDMEAGSALGGSTPPLPKVEVELHCRGTATYSFGHAAHGAHPIGGIRDVLTRKRGGLRLAEGADGYIVPAHWDAQAQKLFDEGVAGVTGAELFTSHVLDKPTPANDVIANIASYFDGHIRERNGKLEVDWQPNNGTTTSPVGLREISLHEMAGEPSIEPEDLDNLATAVIVTGLDWTSDPPLSEASEIAQIPYARRLIGESRTVQLNRPGWCARSQIKAAAQLEAAVRANPGLKVRVPVLRQYATHLDGVTPLRPGDRFTLDWEPVGLDIVVRIVERSKETATRVEFLVQVERGAFPRPYEPALDPRVTINQPPPSDLTRFAAAQFPRDLSDVPAVAILAERPGTNASGVEVHFSPSNTWPGQVLSPPVTRWAVGAVLAGAMAAAGADVTVQVGTVGIDWSYFASQSALQQSDDTLLMYHGGEWHSVGTITPVGGGSYQVHLKRGRLGSVPVAHAAGSVVFFIYRALLTKLEHASFYAIQAGGVYDETTATKWFKLRPYNSAGQGTLTAAFSLVLRNWWGESPIIELGAVPTDPRVGVTYAVSGEIVDLSGDLQRLSVSLARIVGGVIESEITALSRDVMASEKTAMEFRAYCVFPLQGTWRIIVRAWDDAGNVAEEQSADFAVAESDGGTYGPDDGINPAAINVATVEISALVEGQYVKWALPTDTPTALVEVYSATVPVRPALPKFPLAGAQTFVFNLGLAEGSTNYYWFRRRARNGRWSDYSGPVSAVVPSWPRIDDIEDSITGKITKSLVAPASPAVNDLWIDEALGNLLKVWDGAAWQPARDALLSVLNASVTDPSTGLAKTRADLLSGAGTWANGDSALATSIFEVAAAAALAQGTANSAVTQASTAQAGVDSVAAEYVLRVETNVGGQRRITGIRVTNQGGAGGGTDIVLQGDKVAIVNASGDNQKAPFVIEGDVVWMNMAMIKNASIVSALIASLAAAKIEAGDLSAMTLLASKTATDTEFFNAADRARTMPAAAFQQAEDGTHVTGLASAPLERSLVTFHGWMSGGTGYSEGRFGKTTMRFVCSHNGGSSVAAGQWLDLKIAYKINGGGWIDVTPFTARALDSNGALNISGGCIIGPLVGTDVIEFGVRVDASDDASQLNVTNLAVTAHNV